MRRGAARPAAARPKRRGAHATRPRAPLRKRLRPRLPSAGRLLAGALFATVLVALVVLVNGPWLRIRHIAFAGQQLTAEQQLADATASLHGASLLTLQSDAVLERLHGLPAVADVRIEPRLLDGVEVTVVEKRPAFVWRTSRARLVGAADGTLIAAQPLAGKLPELLARLPQIDDRRPEATQLAVGDAIPDGLLDTAMRLSQVDPARLGSSAKRLDLRLDLEHGFLLVSSKPDWQAAFGLYGLDPTQEQPPEGRIEQQIAAVRTLFATHPEASVSWVDARNPGKVYFRAKG
jgi:cell division septal protein FtsQ